MGAFFFPHAAAVSTIDSTSAVSQMLFGTIRRITVLLTAFSLCPDP
jgi:hypothetical protein